LAIATGSKPIRYGIVFVLRKSFEIVKY
jgi:hypothetical protein